MSQELPTIEVYRGMLERHDWYYHRSDSTSVYARGKQQHEKLRGIANDGGGEYKRLWEEKNKEVRKNY